MNYKFILFFLFALGASFVHAAPPIISYAGKVSADGQPFTGTGLFKFAILNAENNASLWSNDGTSVNGSQPSASVGISVNGGLYSILLGNNAISAMGSIDPTIFLQHNDTRLRIWFSDGQGFEQLTPDRPFASVPYALNANIAPGSIENQHLSPSVRADLNRTITKSMLGSDVLNDLNATIGLQRLSAAVRSDLNRTVTKSMLGTDVLSDLNRTITKDMLSSAIQNEVNASSARIVGASLTNPYGSQGTFVFARGEYTVPQNKVMVVTSVGNSLKVLDMFANFSPVIRASNSSTVAIVPSGARISSSDANKSISGLLFSSLPGIEPIIGSVTYKVPLGKTLVITSSSNEVNANLDNDLVRIRNAHDPATFVTMGNTVSVPHANYRWSGYLIDQTNDAPRYWRMVIADQDSSGWEAYVYEMQLKDKDGNVVSGPNLGTAQTSTKRNQTETTPGIFDASMVFDGSESTFLQTEFGNGKLGKWISYTFNQGQWIHAIRVKGYSGASNSIPSWHIEYSMDNGSSWTKAWTATNMGALWKEDSF